QDPDGLGGHAARLEGDALVLDGGGGGTHAQAAVHAVRRVLDLERRLVNSGGAAVAVVQVHSSGHQAGRVELGHVPLEGEGEVFRRVAVAAAEQDDRLADLRALAEHVHDEVRAVVRAELTAKDVNAVVATRRG